MISPAPLCKHRPLIRGHGAKPELLGAKEDERTGRPCVPRLGVPMSCGHRGKASWTPPPGGVGAAELLAPQEPREGQVKECPGAKSLVLS